MKKKKIKERKIITILLTLTMFFTVLAQNSVIFVAANSDASAENEAAVYSITSVLSEDKQSSEVTLTMTPRENIEIQSVILPDGTEQDFNNEVMTYVSHENKDIVFEISYVNNQSEESKTEKLTTTIQYTVSGIETADLKVDEEKQPAKRNAEGVVASNELLKSASADLGAMTTLDISQGSITITDSNVTGWDAGGVAVTAVDPEGYIIIGAGGTNTLTVRAATTTIVLDNMSIDTTVASSPMLISGNANVNLLLRGANSLQTSNNNAAALRVDVNSSLTIDSAEGAGSSNGSLSAKNIGTGTTIGMGIGSAKDSTTGEITILGGTIDAKGGAGIGGRGEPKITISGGNVTAQGAQTGAGIGGFNKGAGTTIISGGIVKATGGSGGAGIGTGNDFDPVLASASVTISGKANVTATGGGEAAGIGLGQTGTKMDITISGEPTIDATGRRAGIGGGGQGDMVGTIKISGGNIKAKSVSSQTAIGVQSAFEGKACNIFIANATIYGIQGAWFLRGNNIELDNVKMPNLSSEEGAINAAGNLTIFNETKLNLVGLINAEGDLAISDKTELQSIGAIIARGKITVDDSLLLMENTTNGSINSRGSAVNISNSIINMETKVDKIIAAKTDITIAKSNVKMATGSTKASTYGTTAGGTINFVDSNVSIAFNGGSANEVVADAPNINVNGGSIISNGYVNGTTEAGIINIQKGYIDLTHQTNGILSKGDINISGGYINLAKGIETKKELNIKAIAGAGDGNAIIFASQYAGNTSNIEQGIIFYNDSTMVPEDQYKGFVYGDVTLSNMIEEVGTKFTIPKEYTLYLRENEKATLTVPLNTKLVNEGKIINARTVTTEGTFENAGDAMVMNCNLTPDKGTATGGEFKGSGTLTNAGDVQNEVYVASVTLDGANYTVVDGILSTKNEMQDIIGSPNSKLVYARQGKNTLSYNNIIGKSLTSEWKYINTDIEYFTLTYDENYEGEADIPSIIVGKGKVITQETPTRNGYTFNGWYRGVTNGTNVELGKEWNFDTDEITEATTLYAK